MVQAEYKNTRTFRFAFLEQSYPHVYSGHEESHLYDGVEIVRILHSFEEIW